MSDSEAGRLFVRGYFAVKWHLGLLGYKQYSWAWEQDNLKHQVEVSKTMTRRQFELMMRYFRCVPHAGLPANSSSQGYHPLQNINGGVQLLREKSVALWNVGCMLCIDEGRIVSKSRRNKYKTGLPKPIRMGYTVDKLVDKSEKGVGYFVLNHDVHVGKYSYVDPKSHGEMFDLVDQLLGQEMKGLGKTIVMDSAFSTTDLMKIAREDWQTRIVATASENDFYTDL